MLVDHVGDGDLVDDSECEPVTLPLDVADEVGDAVGLVLVVGETVRRVRDSEEETVGEDEIVSDGDLDKVLDTERLDEAEIVFDCDLDEVPETDSLDEADRDELSEDDRDRENDKDAVTEWLDEWVAERLVLDVSEVEDEKVVEELEDSDSERVDDDEGEDVCEPEWVTD